MDPCVDVPPARPRLPGAAWTLGLLLALAAPAAAAPRDELLRLVPNDVGFCLLLQDLRGHAAALQNSPFIEQVRNSPVGRALRNAQELTRLDAIEANVLRAHLDTDWTRLREDILGDALVLAYKPGPAGKPDEEQGLVLVRARAAKPLADLIARVNAMQKESGKLKELSEREYRGLKYYKRVDDRDTGYYSLRGPVLMYSGQEDMLRQALERASAAESAPESAVARALREMGAEQALLALWINPRALDAEVEAKGAQAAEKEPARAAGQKTAALCWKALDTVVVAVHLERDLRVSLGLRGRPEQMPAGVRRFLAELARPSDLWRVFPDNALFAVAVRVNAAALFDAIGDFLPPEGRAALRNDIDAWLDAFLLGQDFVKDVLPAIGPDWGLCVVPPAAGDKGWFPQVLAAVRVDAAVADPIEQGLLTALQGVVFWHNTAHPDRLLRVRKEKVGNQEVKYLAGDRALPTGVQPALGLRDGYLMLASSLDVFRRFHAAAAAPAPAGDTPLLRLSFKDARAYVKDRRQALAGALADRDGLTVEDAGRRLDNLLTALQFLDRLELRQRSSPGQVVFTLSLQPAQPFKK
jgi:hypothetical protein